MPSLIELEHEAAKAATEELRRRLRHHLGRSIALFSAVGAQQRALTADLLATELAALGASSTSPAMQTAAETAAAIGAADAARRLSLSLPLAAVTLPREVRQAISRAEAKAKRELKKAARVMAVARTLDDVQAAMAVAARAVSRTEAAARFAVNRSLSAGVATVVRQAKGLGLDVVRVWECERDACLHCLAYAGQVADPGVPFPGGLTFARRPLATGPVTDPPLHPNCRCRVRAIRRADAAGFTAAQKREAQRSVLRGWSLPSESEKARLTAADALLKRTALPKSVQAYAARSVRLGRFPSGRRVP